MSGAIKMLLTCLALLTVTRGALSLAAPTDSAILCNADFVVKVALGNYLPAASGVDARYWANILFDYKGTTDGLLRPGPNPLYISDSSCIDTTLSPGPYVVAGSISTNMATGATTLRLNCNGMYGALPLIKDWKETKALAGVKNDRDLASILKSCGRVDS